MRTETTYLFQHWSLSVPAPRSGWEHDRRPKKKIEACFTWTVLISGARRMTWQAQAHLWGFTEARDHGRYLSLKFQTLVAPPLSAARAEFIASNLDHVVVPNISCCWTCLLAKSTRMRHRNHLLLFCWLIFISIPYAASPPRQDTHMHARTPNTWMHYKSYFIFTLWR